MIEGAAAAPSRGVAHHWVAVRGARVSRLLRGDPELMLVAIIFLALILAALIGPLIWQKDALKTSGDLLLPPSFEHPMGTDGVGRDLLARFNAGARISLLAAAFVVAAGGIVGGLLGLVSGALGGLVDTVIMRLMDALLAFPPLILAMAVTVGLGVGLHTAAVGVALTAVPTYARLVRANVVRVRALPMIEASVALGASRNRIMFKHILPQTTTTLLVTSAAIYGHSILNLAALGFVGLGAQIPTPEWGATITDGLRYALTGEWWVSFFPGVGVLLATVAANLLSDRIQAHLDPRGARTGRRRTIGG